MSLYPEVLNNTIFIYGFFFLEIDVLNNTMIYIFFSFQFVGHCVHRPPGQLCEADRVQSELQ